MAKVVEIRWHLKEDGSGHVTQFTHGSSGVRERTYVFESLNRRDQIPPKLASVIRQDGRVEATVTYETA